MTTYNEYVQVAKEAGLTEAEAEREAGYWIGEEEGYMFEYLISLGGDRNQHREYAKAWTERYPEYPAQVKMNPHDFGTYPSVEIQLNKALQDEETFPKGPELASIKLAEELGFKY